MLSFSICVNARAVPRLTCARHGAAEGTVMMHLAISLGHTSWKEEVVEDEWRRSIADVRA